jgi:hypothetical protein
VDEMIPAAPDIDELASHIVFGNEEVNSGSSLFRIDLTTDST